MNDTTLSVLRRARQGDRDAIATLLKRNEERLAQHAQKRLGAELRAKIRISDLLQTTYLDVLRAMPEFDGETEEDFSSWLLRILENNIRDKGKYFRARKRVPGDAAAELRCEAIDPDESELTPSAHALIAEDFVIFNRALDNLPADYRRVISLRLIQGLSCDEAAKRMERTLPSTRSLLSRARASLVLEFDRLQSGSVRR